MRVSDIMGRKIVTVGEGDSLALALQVMLWNGVHNLPVMRGERLVGILSEGDVLRAEVEKPLKLATVVKEVMSPAEHVHPNADLADAASDMSTRKVDCLPVVDAGQLVGVLTRTDVLSNLAQCPVNPQAQQGLTARDVMTRDPVCVAPDDLLLEAAARMTQHGFRHLCVVDGSGEVIGMLSDRDLRSFVGNPLEAAQRQDASLRLANLRVSHAMTEGPRIAVENTPIADLVNIFLLEHVGALPVIDQDDRLCGIVSYIDVLRAVAAGVI